jgi:hypothetical protein
MRGTDRAKERERERIENNLDVSVKHPTPHHTVRSTVFLKRPQQPPNVDVYLPIAERTRKKNKVAE